MREFRYDSGDAVRITRDGNSFTVQIGERTYTARVQRYQDGELVFTLDGEPHRALVARDGITHYVAFGADVQQLTRAEGRTRRRQTDDDSGNLSATMHGQVVKVDVQQGDSVQRGQTLIVLEAMKMEIRITAPHDGKVIRMYCEIGQIVERGQLLVELSAH